MMFKVHGLVFILTSGAQLEVEVWVDPSVGQMSNDLSLGQVWTELPYACMCRGCLFVRPRDVAKGGPGKAAGAAGELGAERR